MAGLPLPPTPLMTRVARPPAGRDPGEFFLETGRRARQRLDELKPEGWSWEGRRVLDFGCGAGRALRHFLPDAGRTQLYGCDIDEHSIGWLRENLSPPLTVFQVGPEARLPQPEGYFDAIWGISVFTHIDRDWAEWLLELRRVLAHDGWLLLTFLSDGMLELWDELSRGEPWDPDRVGMAVLRPHASWDEGGPTVFLSEWWLRSHWGRAFVVERVESRGFGGPRAERGLSPWASGGHGFALLRRGPGHATPEDLRRPDPTDPREALAALGEAERRRRDLDELLQSRSWRATEPMRAGARALRRLARARGR